MPDIKLVAEIGCNHQGNIALAHQLIDCLAESRAVDYAKFQKRNIRELLSEAEYLAPHPVPTNSFGATYGAHREFLEFSVEQHAELKAHCEKAGLRYACSVWDLSSANEIISLKPDYLKIPSACNLNFPLLSLVSREYRGPLHISLGMTSSAELTAIAAHLRAEGSLQRCVFYACVSAYPAEPADSCLLEIPRLREEYCGMASEVGFSGHHLDTSLDIAAFALGARWIERHITLDREWKGTDHHAALLPTEFVALRRSLSTVAQALRYKEGKILPTEIPHRQKLKRVVPAADQGI